MSNQAQRFRVCILTENGTLDTAARSAWQQAGVTELRICTASDLATKLSIPEVPDLVVIRQPDEEARELLGQLHAALPLTPIAVWSTTPTVRGAVDAIHKGAADYLSAAPAPEGIESLVRKARSLAGHQLQGQTKGETPSGDDDWQSLLGQGPAMKKLLREVQAVAAHDATVLLQGETGSGKERVARLIHRLSTRAARPFIVCNCSAIVPTLAESELFGHEKGAFTGARRAKAGLFEAARGGTLFFDQIQELPPALQPKILRVLENREFNRIGGARPLTADVRVIAAASRDLRQEVKERRFREDLFYRLNTATLAIPPLRERREDIPLLVQHFLESFSQQFHKPDRMISQEGMSWLGEQPWDGNVRELRNTIERAVAISRRRIIALHDLQPRKHPRSAPVAAPEPSPQAMQSLDEVEREQIRRVLEMTGGNRERAARALGLSRSTLYRRLAELGIQ